MTPPRLALLCAIAAVLVVGARATIGEVRLLVGVPGTYGYTDGEFGKATFYQPFGSGFSPDGKFLYVADAAGYAIRKVDIATRRTSTFAGSAGGGASGATDAKGTSARFSYPTDIVLTKNGATAYVADRNNHRIRKINVADAAVTTAAGGSSGFADASGTSAKFYYPSGLALSPDDKFILVADYYNHRIRHLSTADNKVTTLAGQGSAGFADASGTSAKFYYPSDIAVSSDGKFAVVADRSNQRIRHIVIATRQVTTLAGSADAGGQDGTGTKARFSNPNGVAIAPDQSYVLAANGHKHTIRKLIIATKVVTTIAGQDGQSGSADGSIGNATLFNYPEKITFSPTGSYAIVADKNNHLLRRLTVGTVNTSSCKVGGPDGGRVITQSSGSRAHGKCSGGRSIDVSKLNSRCEWNAANTKQCSKDDVDYTCCKGNATCGNGGATGYGILDNFGGSLADGTCGGYTPYYNRKRQAATCSDSGRDGVCDGEQVAATCCTNIPVSRQGGTVTTLAPVGGTGTGTNDGTAREARFYYPQGSAISKDGNTVYVADGSNHRIRMVNLTSGVVSTLAGASGGDAGSGSGTTDASGNSARFNYPIGLALSPDESFLLVADGSNNRIRKVVVATRAVTTLAGSSAGFADASGTSAKFNHPRDVALAWDGKLAFVADYRNHRIRQIVVATKAVSTLAGQSSYGHQDASGASAKFYHPWAVDASPDGKFLAIADYVNHRIRKLVLADKKVTTLAGASSSGNSVAVATGANARFYYPRGVQFSGDGGTLLISDGHNHRLATLNLSSPQFTVTHLAGPIGSRGYGFSDGTGTDARFYYPGGSACPRNPSLTFCVVADGSSHAIRKVVLKDGLPAIIGPAPPPPPPPQCVLPTNQTGYEYTVNGNMTCESLVANNISCSVQPSCARGYYGDPTDSNHTCSSAGKALTLGGCLPCPTLLNASAQPNGDFCVCPKGQGWQKCLAATKCWTC